MTTDDRCSVCVLGHPLDTRGMTHLVPRAHADGGHALVPCVSAEGQAARAEFNREVAKVYHACGITGDMPIGRAPMVLGADADNVRRPIESHSIGLILDSEMVNDGTERITEEERTP